MTTTLPIAPLLALSRVDYLASSMLCIQTTSSLAALRENRRYRAEDLRAFQAFLPKFLGVDSMDAASPDTVLSVSLLAVGPALRDSGLISPAESQVSSYIEVLQSLYTTVAAVLEQKQVPADRLLECESFCRELGEQLVSSAEQALQEGQSLPL